MAITRFLAAGLMLTATIGMAAAQSTGKQPSDLTVAEFEKLHQELQPPKDELWRTIPWHVSLLEARDQAAKTQKPIFVWVASGEPLGCG